LKRFLSILKELLFPTSKAKRSGIEYSLIDNHVGTVEIDDVPYVMEIDDDGNETLWTLQ